MSVFYWVGRFLGWLLSIPFQAIVAALIGVGEGFAKHGWGASFNTGSKKETRAEFEARSDR